MGSLTARGVTALTAKRRNRILPRADAELERLKADVAEDLGLADDIAERGYANMTTREVGTIGGRMVRRLVRRGEQALAEDHGRDGS